VQVGSHTHFFEVNKALEFDRKKSLGCRLNIPAGTAIRFEPGDSKIIELVEFGGKKIIYGFHGLVHGNLKSASIRNKALRTAKKKNFKGA
jgi:urease beta subunit